MIRSEVRDGITRVVLDRPGKANALSGDMLALLAAALDAADTPVLVLSGAGRVFSAGADLSEIDGGLATDPVWERIRQEAEQSIQREALLGGFMHQIILQHSDIETALSCSLAQKLASAQMSEQALHDMCALAYANEPELALAARADIMASYDRDPACHRYMQPLLYFKGFQAVQAYRVAH